MSEFEPRPAKPEIVVPTLDDVESWRRMQAASWLDTYPNEAAGVTYDWVKETSDAWLTPEAIEASRGRVEKMLEHPDTDSLFVAKVGKESVGMGHTTHVDGHQRIEAFYVAHDFRGTGVAQQLFDRITEKFDAEQPAYLEVVAYNLRAQRFYEKNGFHIIPGSEHMFKEKLPSLKMMKPGGTQ